MDLRSPFLRRLANAFYTLMYLGFAGIGLFQLLTPSPTVQAEAGLLTYLWAVMLLVGGLLGVAGTVGGWWLPELLAQPLLAFPFVLWGFAVGQSGVPTRWAFVSLCVMVAARGVGRSIRLAAGVRPKREAR